MTDAELLARLDEIGSGDYIRPDDVAPLCREVNEALRRLLNVVTQLQNALSVRDAQRAEITRERDEAERQCAALRDALRGLLSRCEDCGWPIKAEDMTPMQVARAALAPEREAK